MANSYEGPNQTVKSNKRWASIANAIVQQTGKVVQSQQQASVFTKPKLRTKNG